MTGAADYPDTMVRGDCRKYMPLNVAEFQFRYNNRDNADIFGAAIAGC